MLKVWRSLLQAQEVWLSLITLPQFLKTSLLGRSTWPFHMACLKQFSQGLCPASVCVLDVARPWCGCDGCQASSRACTHCVAFLSFSAEAQRRPYYADYSPARKYIHSLCTSHYLDLFITFIIGINVITMSMEHYNQPKVRAAQQCVGCETRQRGGGSQPRFPGTVPCCLRPSAASRFSVTHPSSSRPALHSVTCHSQKLDSLALV